MLTYNTQLRRLPLPEYGRNIQSMVDYCLTIPDREERTACAYSIISAMSTLFPELKAPNGDYNHKLWDHLMIMSDFNLDIDFPCEVITRENLHTLPDPVPYTTSPYRLGLYGKNVELLIDRASAMEPGEERDELVKMIGYQMKKIMIEHNGDSLDDTRVFDDIAHISHGRIVVGPGEIKLRDIIAPPKPTGKRKKKK